MTSENRSPKLEYNLAGGLLMTVNVADFQELQQGLAATGFTHGCVLPFRALMGRDAVNNLNRSPLTIAHFEEAWNPTDQDSLGKALVSGGLGQVDRLLHPTHNRPLLQDSLFPSSLSSRHIYGRIFRELPQANCIAHQFIANVPASRLLVEINPGINLGAAEILDRSQADNIGLVFDTSHLLSSSRTVSVPGAPTVAQSAWEDQFNFFAPQLKVVDIHPSRPEETAELLTGRGVLVEVAAAAKQVGVDYLRVEVPIPVLHQLPLLRPHHRAVSFLANVASSLS
jgi:hypothetical protein